MNGMSSLPPAVLTISPTLQVDGKAKVAQCTLLYFTLLEIKSGCFSLLRKKNFRTSYLNIHCLILRLAILHSIFFESDYLKHFCSPVI